MSSPAAAVPLAVLVLAWDETVPAVRALVEATEFSEPALDSVAVLVPVGPAAEELTQEEFLPLESSSALPELLPAEAPAHDAPEEIASSTSADESTIGEVADVALPTASATAPAGPSLQAFSPAATQSSASPLPAGLAPTTAEALVRPALVWKEVRVLRLGGHGPNALTNYAGAPQPALVWHGVPTLPAAPYLGSSEPAQPIPSIAAAGGSGVAAALLAATSTAATTVVALRTLGLPSSGLPLPNEARPTPGQAPAYPTTERPAAPDAELDTMPAPAASEPFPAAEASITELSEEAAETDEAFTVDVSPVQTGGSIQPTLPPAEEAAAVEAEFFSLAEEDATPPSLAALRPAARPFNAPDLNFQIIQYARLAVPRALAEQPFGVIYAPAWPTWLAAQELRHRTGQPLVLHIAKLAAAEDEHLDLAAGWVAEIQRQALHRADLILTETAALAQRLRHELALPAHRVRPVPAADAPAVAQALRTAQRQ